MFSPPESMTFINKLESNLLEKYTDFYFSNVKGLQFEEPQLEYLCPLKQSWLKM